MGSDESSDSASEAEADADIKGVDQDEGLAKMLDSESSSSDEDKEDKDDDDDEDETGKKKKRKRRATALTVQGPEHQLRTLTRLRKGRPWWPIFWTLMLLMNPLAKNLDWSSLVQRALVAAPPVL